MLFCIRSHGISFKKFKLKVTYNFQSLYDKPWEYRRKLPKSKTANEMLFLRLFWIHFYSLALNTKVKNSWVSEFAIFEKLKTLQSWTCLLNVSFTFGDEFKNSIDKKVNSMIKNLENSLKLLGHTLTRQNHMWKDVEEVIEGLF